MLEGRVSRENGVVRLNDGARKLRGGVHAELKLGLLAVVVGKTLHQQSTETRASSTAERVENEEALEAIAIVRKAADFVHDGVNQLLSDGVVTAGIYLATRQVSTAHALSP